VPRLDQPRGALLHPIRGSINDNIPWPEGCAFAPRCDNVLDVCVETTPDLLHDGYRLLRCHNPVNGQSSEATAGGPAEEVRAQ
jgi:peptide/nickel transport system ATP-binding protein